MAVLGEELKDGSFEVEDYCFAGPPEEQEAAETVAMETDTEDDK